MGTFWTRALRGRKALVTAPLASPPSASGSRSSLALSTDPLILALEPRLMFDASVAATAAVAEVMVQDHGHTDGIDVRPVALEAASAPARHDIVFVDGKVSGAAQIAQSLPAGTEVVMLDGSKDGFAQMASYLNGSHDIDSISLISHGDTARVQAGSVWLSSDSLAAHADALKAIGAALSADGDLLLYGCKTGEGSAGQHFLDQIAAITSADVAGSTDNTGAAAYSGNWTLERSTGAIEAADLGRALVGYSSLLAAPTYETFDGLILPDDGGQRYFLPYGQELVFNGWLFAVTNQSNNLDPASRLVGTNQSLDTNLANDAQDKALVVDGSASTNAYQLVIKSNSGEEFAFNSITVEDLVGNGGNFRLLGYKNGVQVSGASYDFTAPYAGGGGNGVVVHPTTQLPWNSVDEIRIVNLDTSFGTQFAIDDLNVSAAVTNAVPVIANLNGDAFTYLEGSGTVKIDVGQNATVTDTDSTNFSGGNLTVQIITNYQSGTGAQDSLNIVNDGAGAGQIGISSNNVTYGGTTIGTVTGNGTGTLVVNFNAAATPTAVQALVRNIGFNHAGTNPLELVRTVQFRLNDGDSVDNSANSNVSIDVRPVNNAPTLSAINQDPTFTENGSGVSLFGSTAVSTIESGQSINTLTLTVGNVTDGASEVLSIDGTNVSLFNGNSLTTATLGVGVSVSVSGGVATVTVDKSGGLSAAQAQSLVNGLTYRDTSEAPTAGSRAITLTSIRDNGGTANGGTDTTALSLTSMVTVVAVNDAPVLTTSGGNAAFTAGDNTVSTPVVVDSGLTLSDVDTSTMASATVRISGNFVSGEDQLIFANTNSALYGNITASYNSAAGVMTLSSSGSTATTAQWQAALRSVRYTDSAVTPNTATRTISFQINDGTYNSNTSTRTVTVAATDQTPLLSNSGGSATFTEGQGPAQVDPGLSVSDLDNATLSSAAVQIAGNFRSGEDLLLFTNTSSVTYGNIIGSYNAGTGVLTLTSAGSTATLAQWQAALRSVNYANTSLDPDTATRTIAFTVSDGTKTSAAGTRDVNVISVDIPPVLGASGGSVTFTEGNQVAGAAVVVDSGLTLSDADSTTLASATVAVTGNFQAGADVLGFTNTNSTLYGNIAASYDASTGVLLLSSAGATATVAQWQAALRNVSYSNTSDTPSASTRTVSFSVNDGGVSSNSVSRDVNVVPVDDTPVLSGGTGTPVFQELDGQTSSPVAVAPGLLLSDTDSPTLVSATVAITGNLQTAQDLLTFINGDATQFGNISGSYDAATGVLSLSSAGGTATAAQWQAALRSVTYSNSAEAPNTATRAISITVNDGSTDSNTVVRSVAVTSTNDTPVNQTPVAEQHVFQDSTLMFGSAQGNAIAISDADAGNGLVQVTLTASQGTLSLAGINGLSFVVGSGTSDTTMTFTGSVADINAALQGLSFSPTAGYRGPASLQITTDDLGNSGGPARTATDTITVSVDPTFPTIIGVNTPTPDGGYKVGDTITTTITFDQAVVVDASNGVPCLLLETGTVDRQAVYVSGSGTNTLTFRYVVQAGDTTTRLDYASSAALALNGGSIRSATQFDAVLALPTPGGGDSLAAQHALQIDGVAPTVTGVQLPAAGTYVAGQSLDITVNYSEAVTVSGNGAAPRLAVTLDDGRIAYADYVSGSGSNALLFRYTVQAGQQAAAGVALAGSLDANGAVLRDAVGNTASVTLTGVGATSGIRVDAVTPTVAAITRLDGGATSGQPVRYQVTFSENVSGVDAADFTLSTTGNASGAVLGVTQVDGRTYVVEVGQIAGAGQVSLNLAATASGIVDAAGNALAEGGGGPAYVVAPVAPPPLPADPPAPAPAPTLIPVVPSYSPPITFDAGPSLPSVDAPQAPTLSSSDSSASRNLPVALGLSVPLQPNPLDRTVVAAAPVPPSTTRTDSAESTTRNQAGLEATRGYLVTAGEPMRIALPFDTQSALGRDGPLTVEVRLANGRPLPAWLKYDPVTNTLVGRAPAGLNQKLSIEVVVRDSKGQQVSNVVEVEVKPSNGQRSAAPMESRPPAMAGADRGTADGTATGALDRSQAATAVTAAPLAGVATADTDTAAKAPAGRAGLAAQFNRHGHAAWQTERQQWEQFLDAAQHTTA
ncbi:MAG: DUF4347 domain-containing protein [Roseateles sp.]|nr:MAG: DUF4347 domain-containing protein [Roseateles sp.]